MAIVDKFTLKLQLEGFAGIKGIDSDFKKFTSTLKLTKPQLDKFIKGITNVHGKTKLSKTAFEGQIGALTKLQNHVGAGTKAYQRIGQEINNIKFSDDKTTNEVVKRGLLEKIFGGVGTQQELPTTP